MMEVIESKIKGVKVIKPLVFEDFIPIFDVGLFYFVR